jgi:hypothetical protein
METCIVPILQADLKIPATTPVAPDGLTGPWHPQFQANHHKPFPNPFMRHAPNLTCPINPLLLLVSYLQTVLLVLHVWLNLQIDILELNLAMHPQQSCKPAAPHAHLIMW